MTLPRLRLFNRPLSRERQVGCPVTAICARGSYPIPYSTQLRISFDSRRGRDSRLSCFIIPTEPRCRRKGGRELIATYEPIGEGPQDFDVTIEHLALEREHPPGELSAPFGRLPTKPFNGIVESQHGQKIRKGTRRVGKSLITEIRQTGWSSTGKAGDCSMQTSREQRS